MQFRLHKQCESDKRQNTKGTDKGSWTQGTVRSPKLNLSTVCSAELKRKVFVGRLA